MDLLQNNILNTVVVQRLTSNQTLKITSKIAKGINYYDENKLKGGVHSLQRYAAHR